MSLKHTGHIIETHTGVDPSTHRRYQVRIEKISESCKACKKEKEDAVKKEHELNVRNMKESDVLLCDNCNLPMGYVSPNDMEGSYFYCNRCVNSNKII